MKFEMTATDLGITGYHRHLYWSGKGVHNLMGIIAKGKIGSWESERFNR